MAGPPGIQGAVTTTQTSSHYFNTYTR